MPTRAAALADRIEQGAALLAAYAATLSPAQWGTAVRPDGRTAGVIVHHVAAVYPIEVDLARSLARGAAVAGVTWAAIAEMNAKHASEHATVSQADAIALLRRNSAEAAAAVRGFSDADLDNAAPLSLNDDAPMTAQFMIEAHALCHSFHHLAVLRAHFGC